MQLTTCTPLVGTGWRRSGCVCVWENVTHSSSAQEPPWIFWTDRGSQTVRQPRGRRLCLIQSPSGSFQHFSRLVFGHWSVRCTESWINATVFTYGLYCLSLPACVDVISCRGQHCAKSGCCGKLHISDLSCCTSLTICCHHLLLTVTDTTFRNVTWKCHSNCTILFQST